MCLGCSGVSVTLRLYLICRYAQLCRLATYDPEIFKFDGDNAYVHYDEPRAGKPVCKFLFCLWRSVCVSILLNAS